LLAQILLKRPDPPPTPVDRPSPGPGREALEHLNRVCPYNAAMSVLVQLNRGKALYRLLKLDQAEAAWLETLRLDPTSAEAGWSLLDLYYLEGREDEARRLALHLHDVEPDPHDRVQLLLELIRQDARPPAPGSLVKWFEPVVQQEPGDLHAALGYGLALVRIGRVESGLDHLRKAESLHPDQPEAWDAHLTGLDESGQIDAMTETLETMPPSIAASPRLVKHRARVAQDRRDWAEAARLYRLARTAEPFNRLVEYRLSRALRHLGQNDEAESIEQRVRRRDIAIQQIRPLYDEANETKGLGTQPHTDLYQRLADARERMQLLDEARAWYRLVLKYDPMNEISRAALARIEKHGEPAARIPPQRAR
jgi:tetratricopeptide (TPR) repeat protein